MTTCTKSHWQSVVSHELLVWAFRLYAKPASYATKIIPLVLEKNFFISSNDLHSLTSALSPVCKTSKCSPTDFEKMNTSPRCMSADGRLMVDIIMSVMCWNVLGMSFRSNGVGKFCTDRGVTGPSFYLWSCRPSSI